MNSPIKFLALAFLAPIGALAAPTYTTVTTIDDFMGGGGDNVSGTGSTVHFNGYTGPYSSVSGTNLFAQTFRIQGTYPNAGQITAIGIDEMLVFYTPVTTVNSSLKVTYYVMDDLNWLSIATTNYLKLDLAYSNLATNFTWTIKDTSNTSATWSQDVAALNPGSPTTYAKQFSDFTTSGSFNWSKVKSLEFSSSTNNGADSNYSGGFLIASSSGATVPEPSTYGIGLGALALAAVAIRRRKAVKA